MISAEIEYVKEALVMRGEIKRLKAELTEVDRIMVSHRIETTVIKKKNWNLLIYKDNTKEKCEWVEYTHFKDLKSEIEKLKAELAESDRCNGCLKSQLDGEPRDCKVGQDAGCDWGDELAKLKKTLIMTERDRDRYCEQFITAKDELKAEQSCFAKVMQIGK